MCKRRVQARWLWLAAAAVALVGCGGGSELDLVPVAGKVTLDGQPLSDAQVFFMSEDGKYAQAITDASGEYVVQTNGKNGMQVGTYKVSVTKQKSAEIGSGDEGPNPNMMAEMMTKQMEGKKGRLGGPPPGMDMAPPSESLIPEKYSQAETSGLTVTISEDGNESANLELTSK